MTKDEVEALGKLARLALTPAEVDNLTKEIGAIVSYVGQINDLVGSGALPKVVGNVHNVFRADEVTVPPEIYTDTLLAAAPKRTGNFFAVPKIIAQDE